MSSMIEASEDDVWYTDTDGLNFGTNSTNIYCNFPYKTSEMTYIRNEYNNLHASKNKFRHSYINVTSNSEPVNIAMPECTEELEVKRFLNHNGDGGRRNTRIEHIGDKQRRNRNIWIGLIILVHIFVYILYIM